jgi:hypothetical protein
MKLHYYDIASTIIGIRDYRHMHIIDSSLREKIVRCAYLKIGINEIDLIESIQTNNVEEFTKIIQKTPEHIKQLEDIEEFPLHCAVCAPIEFTQILLNNSAQVNAINASKETALHLAVEQLRVDLVKLLLEAGVDPNIEDCHGKSPLILVLKSENPEMIRIFELHSESQVNSQLSQHNQTSIDSDIDAISDSSDSEPELSLKIFEFKTISSDNVQTTGEVSDNCCIS